MSQQVEQARAFHALHRKGDPVVLFNIWNPGSARAVAAAGAKAIATGSWPVAAAFGYPDGEKIPLELALENIFRIVGAVDLPVTMDLEGGYGVEPKAVATTIRRAIKAGAIGFNFEDQIVGGSGLHDIVVQAERIKAAAEAVKASGVPAFINSRTDLFLKAKPETHNAAMLDEALERAAAYEKAGAHGFFVPGLVDETLLGKLCAQTKLAVNAFASPDAPSRKRLAELGASRISHGPFPWRGMAVWLESEARKAME